MLISQPEPCPIDNPEMTPICDEACIICDIDGFMGRHESAIPGLLPEDFCTFFVHNAQWIAFQAGSTDLSIELSVSNCEIGSGLEIAIYKSLDCENFELISNCFGGGDRNQIRQGESGIVENTEPLVIGQYYYLTMDGAQGDNCDWEFNVLDGSTEIDPLTFTAPVEGDSIICPSITQLYSTEPEQGAVIFDWTLNGQSVGDNTLPTIELEFDNIGIYDLCVTGKNACDEATTTCKTIEVVTIPITNVTSEFCEGDCYEVDGNIFCEEGIFEYDILLDNGCDSTIVLQLIELEQAINDISINLCDGDTIFIDTIPFFTTGLYSTGLQTSLFCDSIVNLDLQILTCDIESEDQTFSAICFGESSGSIQFEVTLGDPPFTYEWQHLQANLSGSGNISMLKEATTISQLPFGDIIIEIIDGYGFVDVIIAEIVQELPIVIEQEISDYNNFNISCSDLSDGVITIQAEGGQLPYEYMWSTGGTEAQVNDLAAGTYTVSVIDNLGCLEVKSFDLSAPEALVADINFSDPSCSGLQTGQVEIISTTGGVIPYSYSVNNSPSTDQIVYIELSPGINEVVVTDANMCSYQESQELLAPDIPEISGETSYSVGLGCEIAISTTINDIAVQSILWANDSYLDCNDCLDPIAIPLVPQENTLIVTSEDGCSDSLSISFSVETLREFYAPNVFTPSRNGVNDSFSIFGGKEVEYIDLVIYDRWGGIIFESFQMQSGNDGWDGTINGFLVDPGIYVWKASIQFIDGFNETYSGDVMVIE